MNALLSLMSTTEKDLVTGTYDLDCNCLDEGYIQAPEYVLADKSKKLKLTESKKIFDALRGAAERKFGQLRDLPR